jgi:hypothetical protein
MPRTTRSLMPTKKSAQFEMRSRQASAVTASAGSSDRGPAEAPDFVVRTGEAGEGLTEAASTIEDREGEHPYHTQGGCRELWSESLEMTALLPPAEQVQKVETTNGAGRVERPGEVDLP